MTDKKPKFSAIVSPVGTAASAWINKPSAPFEGKGEPQFKITVLLDDTDENRQWCENAVAKALAEAKSNNIKIKKVFHNPFVMPEDVDEDDFIPAEGKDRAKLSEAYKGKIFFTAKSQYKPAVIDTNRKELPEDVFVMSGDEVRAKVQLNPYEGLGSGVSLRLKTVQLVAKNTSFSGRGPDTDGFDDIDGYSYDGNGGAGEDDDEIPF